MSGNPIRERNAEIAKLFRSQLKELGISQAQLARDIGMSPMTVSRWATGAQRPDGIVFAYLKLRLDRKRYIESN